MSAMHNPGAIRGDDAKDKSQLQAIVSVSITNIGPSSISLSSPSPIDVVVSAKQIYSAQPSRPLTLSTWRTPFNVPDPALPVYTGSELTASLWIESLSNHRKTLCFGGPPPRRVYPHWIQPAERDFRDQMGFITVPSLESGESFSITRQVPIDSILQERAKEGKSMPEPGEEFFFRLRSECHVEWWNWGSLESDLRDKKFINLPHPSISGRSEEENQVSDEWVVGYGWNLDYEDEEGNEMVCIEVKIEKQDHHIRFCE